MTTSTEAALRPYALLPVVALAGFWFSIVQKAVPEPYLDEVFHVRQAENYIKGNWRVWDPKITTPPGLYLVSYLFAQPGQALGLGQPSTAVFRSINCVGAILLLCVVLNILFLVHREKKMHVNKIDVAKWSPAELTHAAINICLFPLLFFFYGLYYTDVLSAVSVLFAYRCYLAEKHGAIILLTALLSLFFRQTNILWVSLFLGGLAFCHGIPKPRDGEGFPNQPSFDHILNYSWNLASAYDPPISQACFEDYFKSSLSYVIAGVANFPTVLWPLNPYIIAFSAFIQYAIWNGGIVLGDKENHVVSVHLAQMLYVWPCFMFFSLPLIYPYVLECVLVATGLRRTSSGRFIRETLPRDIIDIPVMVAMLAIVHYNTLVHPFTLADNRHYTFYVFRILLRHPAIKYVAVTIYFPCAWAVIASLGGPDVMNMEESPQQQPSQKKSHKQQQKDSVQPSLILSASGPRASFLLVWLVATTASLITTPLIEPRYFIIPWLMWRLHIAPLRPFQATGDPIGKNNNGFPVVEVIRGCFYKWHDHRLWLETIWFLAINAITGYIFRNWQFQWPQEPGKVQRFMW